MRIFALLIIAVMLAFAVPAFAAPITESPPAMSSHAAETNITPIHATIVSSRTTNPVAVDNAICSNDLAVSQPIRCSSMQHLSRERDQALFCLSPVPDRKSTVGREKPAPNIVLRT